MSAISGFINTIKNAVYGEQVRTAIVDALEQCYSDVNAPSLQTEAFTAALNAAYAGGILDIQTVTQISAMTNQQIIYRYNGTQAGYQKGLYYYSALSNAWVLIGSEVHSVSLANQMTDTNSIYKYTGTESGMVQNSLYCYNGTEWVTIGSGVLLASTAAGMTNVGAIYKYTGNEAGMVQNALYYHNGTSWEPIPTTSTIDNAKNSVVDSLTDYKTTSASNIVDPNNFEYVRINNQDHIMSKEKIAINENLGVRLYGMCKVSQSGSFVNIDCYNDSELLGSIYFNFSSTMSAVSVPQGCNAIKVYFRQYGSAENMGQICISQTEFSEFIEFNSSVDNLKIKDSLIDTDVITNELTDRTRSGNNLIDPLKMRAWGYTYNMSTGEQESSGTQQTIKDLIPVGVNASMYVIIRNPLSAAYGEAVLFCYNQTEFLGVRRSISLTTTNPQTVTLINGTTHIRPVITTPPETFNAEDFCLSFVPLESFEPYQYELKIKQSLLDNQPILTGSKISTLYMKNIVFFGDSIFHLSDLPKHIGQMVGAKMYNASISGSSMSCGADGQTAVTRYWYTGANIAKCIANNDWTATLAAVESASEIYQKALYLSELDWNEVDAIIFALGANDSATDNQENQKDITTYGGAARYIIEALGTAYPKLRIIFCSTIYSRTYNFLPLKTMLEQICESYNVPFIDNYTKLGVNSFNSSEYLIQDGLHQTAAGQELLINHIVQELW